MKQVFIFSILIGLWACKEEAQITVLPTLVTEIVGHNTVLSQTEIKALDSVNIDFQIKGGCYAYSSAKNAIESNGEAHSDNLPQKTDESFPRQGFYLVINQKEVVKLDSTSLGCKLYLVNTTDTLIKLRASDSRLYIVIEALNETKEWTPISYLQSSSCGNSRHTIILDKDEYWSFNVPVFKGKFKTKLRFILSIDKNKSLSSNEIVAYINEGQFHKKKEERHKNNNLMNPYIE
jgi:hypothetical protein